MKMKCLILAVVTSAVVTSAYQIDCNLMTGAGCSNSGPFTFYKLGSTKTWNSMCNLNYRLKVSPLSSYRGTGLKCSFYTDVPQQFKFIYSISEDRFASWRSYKTPYIYGYGLNARVASKQVPSDNWQNTDIRLIDAHSHDDNNHYGYATYQIENKKMTVSTSQSDGAFMRFGSSYLFKPTMRTTWIGLNRRSSTNLGGGSGLCRVKCIMLRRTPSWPDFNGSTYGVTSNATNTIPKMSENQEPDSAKERFEVNEDEPQ